MRINVLVLLLVLLCFISCFLKVVLGLEGDTGETVAVGDGKVAFVNPASFGDEGKTSLGEGFLVVGDFDSNGRSKYEISRGEVEVFIEKSNVEVLEEVVVEDVLD